MFDAPVSRGSVCDEWVDINQQDYVDKKEDHLTDEHWRGDEQEPRPRYTAKPADTAHEMSSGRSKEIWDSSEEMLEPTFRGVRKEDLPKAAGIAVRAADTGRVLMIQRNMADASDPARGTWEFPGGKREDGEHPWMGARREWQEEMGTRLPKGKHVGSWRSGVYQGFIHEVPSEDSVKTNLDHEDRRVMNPDDPDGDQIEVAAWWHPDHLRHMHALRPELRRSRPWRKLAKADSGTLYVVSHAKTRYNDPGADKDKVQGWLNVPIDSQGREEAAMLAKFFKDKDIEALHSSDLKRASQTADILGRHLNLTTVATKRYRPWNLGTYAGHSSEEVIPKLKPFMQAKHADPVDGGESFDTFRDRFIPAFEALLKKTEAGHNTVLVTHSRNIELIQGWLGGKNYRSKVDPKEISADDVSPATVFQIEPNRDGKFAVKELARETVQKATMAHPVTLTLRVGGVSPSPSGRVYRMFTKDGHYVGRTEPTKVKAQKGDALTLNTKHLTLTPQGDPYWLSPVVAGQSPDAVHSWRQLTALAGAAPTRLRGPHLDMHEFDSTAGDTVATTNTNNTWNAPGPAGQIPDPGDDYNAQERVEQDTSGVDYDGEISGRQHSPGPTSAAGRQMFRRRTRKNQPSLASVHVPSPMGNISTAYTATSDDELETLVPRDPRRIRNLPNVDYTKEDTLDIGIVHKEEHRQLVFGVVLEPNVVDTQDDYLHAEDVESAAHGYLKRAIRGKGSVAKIQHRAQGFFKNKAGVTPIESFVAPQDFRYDGSSELVKKGSWVLGLHVEDPKVWEKVMSGEYTGLSIGGSGVRQAAAELPPGLVDGHQWMTSEPSAWHPEIPYTG